MPSSRAQAGYSEKTYWFNHLRNSFPLSPRDFRCLHAARTLACAPSPGQRRQVRGIHHRGRWTDVGTPERLAALERELGPNR